MSGFDRYSPDEKYPPLSRQQRAELRAMEMGSSYRHRFAANHEVCKGAPVQTATLALPSTRYRVSLVAVPQRTAREAMPQTFGRDAARRAS